MDAAGQYLTTDPLFHPDHFGDARPDFKKIIAKADLSKQIELKVVYDKLLEQIKPVDFANLQSKDPGLFAKVWSEVLELHAKGLIEPYISKVIPFRDANKALKFIQGRKCLGKILIDMGASTNSASS